MTCITKDVIDTSAPKLKRGQYIIAKTYNYIKEHNYELLKVNCCKDVMIHGIEKQYYIRTLYKGGKVYYRKFIISTNEFTKKSFNNYFISDAFIFGGEDSEINLRKEYIVLPIETTLDEAILLLTIKNAEKKEGK